MEVIARHTPAGLIKRYVAGNGVSLPEGSQLRVPKVFYRDLGITDAPSDKLTRKS
jgi:hypothetical protein